MPGPLAAALVPAAALVSREYAKRALKKKLAEAATKGTAAAAVGAGAGVAGEALVNKPKKETEAKTETKPQREAKTEAKTETKPKREAPVMGSGKNLGPIKISDKTKDYQGGSYYGGVDAHIGSGKSEYYGPSKSSSKSGTKPATKSDTSSTPTASGRSRENTSPGGGSSANIDTERYKPKDEPKMGSSENIDVDRIGKGSFEADESYTPVPKNQPVKFEDESSTPFYDRFKKGGMVRKKSSDSAKKYVSGGSVSGASKRGDGCAQRGKTRGRIV